MEQVQYLVTHYIKISFISYLIKGKVPSPKKKHCSRTWKNKKKDLAQNVGCAKEFLTTSGIKVTYLHAADKYGNVYKNQVSTLPDAEHGADSAVNKTDRLLYLKDKQMVPDLP